MVPALLQDELHARSRREAPQRAWRYYFWEVVESPLQYFLLWSGIVG